MTGLSTRLRWTPDQGDGGALTEHVHGDGDAYSRRHTHRLARPEQQHVHSTLGDEAADVVRAVGALTDTALTVSRAQDGTVRVKIRNPEWIAGILVDVLAQVASGEVDLGDMPLDPEAAARWVLHETAPLDTVQVSLAEPHRFATELSAIIPAVLP